MAQNPQKRFPVVKRLGRIYTPLLIFSMGSSLFHPRYPMIDSPPLTCCPTLTIGFTSGGEVEIDPRSESDQTKDFSLPQKIPRLGITDDPSCHEPCNLNQEDFKPIFRFQDHGILLIEEG